MISKITFKILFEIIITSNHISYCILFRGGGWENRDSTCRYFSSYRHSRFHWVCSCSLLLNVFSFYPVNRSRSKNIIIPLHWHYVILAKLEMCQSIFGEVCWSNCVRNCGHWWSTKSLQFFKNLKTFRRTFLSNVLIWVRWSTQPSLYFLLRYKNKLHCVHTF